MKKRIGIGIIGYGFIGKVHTLAYQSIPYYYKDLPFEIDLVGVCNRSKEKREEAMKQASFKFDTSDYREIIARDDIDVVNIATYNDTHAEIAIEAAKAGKHIYCEKPLARTVEEAREMNRVAKETGVKTKLAFEYRFIPAMIRAKQIIEEGGLGEVFHFKAGYLHSGYIDPNRPISWRMRKEVGGGGAMFDLCSHVLDLIMFLLGEYESVSGCVENFVKERPEKKGSSKMVKVDVDDYACMNVKMKNGGRGFIEASRFATGTNNDLYLEIHGSKGAIKFDLMQPNYLYYYSTEDPGEPVGGMRGYKQIETVQRYPEPANFPGPKFEIGWIRYNIENQFDFLRSVYEDKYPRPDFSDGLHVQEVMDAAYRSAEQGSSWIKI